MGGLWLWVGAFCQKCPTFGKYAILRLFSFNFSFEFNTIAAMEPSIITAMPTESIILTDIKQRYIGRLNNHRILAQASQIFL